MNRRLRMAVPAVLAALALGAAACGGDDDDDGNGGGGGGEALAKAELIRQADEICKENDGRAEALAEEIFEDVQDPQPEELQEFLQQGTEIQRDTIDKLRDLEPADDVAGEWNEILDAAEQGTERFEEGAESPEAAAELFQSGEDPNAEADEKAKAFGLQECGSDD